MTSLLGEAAISKPADFTARSLADLSSRLPPHLILGFTDELAHAHGGNADELAHDYGVAYQARTKFS